MIKKIFLVSFLIFLTFAPQGAAFGNDSTYTLEDAHPTRIIVRFKPKTSLFEIQKLNKKLGAKIAGKLLFDQTFVVKISKRQQERFIRLFSHSPLVEYAEPDYLARTFEIPNDPGFEKQWGMRKISAPKGWDLVHGIPQIRIAILDTGIDKDHPDLSSKVDQWINFTSSKTTDDLYGHGTHIAGIAAAQTNNELGVAGLGWEAHLLSVKVLDDDGVGYYSWIADGIKWAVDHGALVINLSLGGSKRSKTLENAINYAWKRGAVLACAAGNSGKKTKTYPAYYQACIATAAIDEDDQKTSWSSFGRWVDVAAPGERIFSTLPNHDYKMGKSLNYGWGSGTSMATPHVSGLAALLFGSDKTLSNSDVRALIEENADQIWGTGRYWQKGRINVYQSIRGLAEMGFGDAPTLTPTPTLSLTPTPTLVLTPSPTLTPTPSPQRKKPWWCRRWPRFCN